MSRLLDPPAAAAAGASFACVAGVEYLKKLSWPNVVAASPAVGVRMGVVVGVWRVPFLEADVDDAAATPLRFNAVGMDLRLAGVAVGLLRALDVRMGEMMSDGASRPFVRGVSCGVLPPLDRGCGLFAGAAAGEEEAEEVSFGVTTGDLGGGASSLAISVRGRFFPFPVVGCTSWNVACEWGWGWEWEWDVPRAEAEEAGVDEPRERIEPTPNEEPPSESSPSLPVRSPPSSVISSSVADLAFSCAAATGFDPDRR